MFYNSIDLRCRNLAHIACNIIIYSFTYNVLRTKHLSNDVNTHQIFNVYYNLNISNICLKHFVHDKIFIVDV